MSFAFYNNKESTAPSYVHSKKHTLIFFEENHSIRENVYKQAKFSAKKEL